VARAERNRSLVTVITAAAWQPAVIAGVSRSFFLAYPRQKRDGLPGTLPFRLLSLTGSESP